MFIQTEPTPNPNSLKFLPGRTVLAEGTADFRSRDSAIISPLALALFDGGGVAGVYLGADFITITKIEEKEWLTLKPMVLSVIMNHFMSGKAVVEGATEAAHGEEDVSDIAVQIRELLDTRIRPAVAQDGGDITFEKFEDGIVYLHMKGSCAGCPSSTATLKSGIENMLRHYIPEVEECARRLLMLTLGLDTATACLSVALVRDGQVLACETSEGRRGQSETLLPLVEAACITAGCGLPDIRQIFAVTGPGSFTGLRIGLAAAKGLAMGLGVPGYGVSAFQAVQMAVPAANVIILESWRAELYVWFGAEPEMLTPAEITARLRPGMVLTGDACDKISWPEKLPLPPLAPFATQAVGKSELAPFYVREPDVSRPKAS